MREESTVHHFHGRGDQARLDPCACLGSRLRLFGPSIHLFSVAFLAPQFAVEQTPNEPIARAVFHCRTRCVRSGFLMEHIPIPVSPSRLSTPLFPVHIAFSVQKMTGHYGITKTEGGGGTNLTTSIPEQGAVFDCSVLSRLTDP